MNTNKRMGDYEILDELGSGGMGRVFRVRNVISDRIEAMKVLLPDLAGRQDLAARFLREIKLLAALDHPHIASLRTALTADNQLVMIMEYVEGQSLASRLGHGPIATADALLYIDQALAALGYAHDRNIVHRDVKPANMLLTPQGTVKLTDFGIARGQADQTLTVTGTTTGSLSYMSPEQVNGEATDARSDLYSAGISLYEMVTGKRPFEAESDFGVMLAHLQEKPRPPIELQPALDPGLNAIILKAIAKSPTDRYQSAAEFREAIATLRGAARTTTSSRAATVLISTATATRTAGAAVPVAPPGTVVMPATTDHLRTVLDTRTPASSPAVPPGAPPMPHSAPTSAVRAGHPFQYVALGGVLVIVALVGTGLYLGRSDAEPNRSTTPAASTPPAGSTSPAASTPPTNPGITPAASTSAPTPGVPAATAGTTPSVPPASTPPPPPGGAASTAPGGAPAAKSGSAGVELPRANAKPPATPAGVTAPKPGAREATADRTGAGGPAAPAKAEEARPREAPQDTKELDRLELEIDQLNARAAAVNNSLDRLQSEQARQGLGLRGDMAARQQSMKQNLARADEALGRGDVGRAQKYRDAAEADLEVLERFLGR